MFTPRDFVEPGCEPAVERFGEPRIANRGPACPGAGMPHEFNACLQITRLPIPRQCRYAKLANALQHRHSGGVRWYILQGFFFDRQCTEAQGTACNDGLLACIPFNGLDALETILQIMLDVVARQRCRKQDTGVAIATPVSC